MTAVERDPIVSQILDCAIRVHRALGPGLLESAYQACLNHALLTRGLRVQRQVPVPIAFEHVTLDCGYRLDLVVDGDSIVEVKSVDKLQPIHDAQVLTYLRLAGARRALLLNFNALRLKDGIRSFLAPGQAATRSAESE